MRGVQSRERSSLRLRARRPMRLLPVRAPPAEDEGTRRDCPVCLEEISVNADWVSLTAGQDWVLHDTNDCLSCQAAVVMLCVSVICIAPLCPRAHLLVPISSCPCCIRVQVVFPCGHGTCRECYQRLVGKLLEDEMACPMCRAPLAEVDPGARIASDLLRQAPHH